MHYTDNTPVKFFHDMKDIGYEFEFENESSEDGYDTSISIFSGSCSFVNKSEFMRCVRADINTFKAYGYVK